MSCPGAAFEPFIEFPVGSNGCVTASIITTSDDAVGSENSTERLFRRFLLNLGGYATWVFAQPLDFGRNHPDAGSNILSQQPVSNEFRVETTICKRNLFKQPQTSCESASPIPDND